MAYSFASASSQHLTATLGSTQPLPWTLYCRGNPSQTNLNNALFGFASTTVAGNRSTIFYAGSGTANFYMDWNLSSGFFEITSSTSYTASTWSDIAGVMTSTTSRGLFFNGVSQGTNSTPTATYNAFSLLSIGSRRNSTDATYGNFLNGLAAEAALWSVALTAAEIASLSKGFKPHRIRPQSLVFYAPLIRTLQDTKGALAITNNNSATVAAHPRVI